LNDALLAAGLWRPASGGMSGGRRRLDPLLVCAALATSLHAAVLTLPVRGDAPPLAQRHAAPPLAVRLLAAPGEPSVRPPALSTGAIGSAAGPATVRPEPDLRPAARESTRQTGSASASVSPAVHGLALRMAGVLSDDDYFTRSALDVAPHPTQPVLIEYPPATLGGRHVSELSLFIDETGRVVKVRVDGPPLPAAMEDAARRAFMGASFSPGQVDGLPVRSRIRIEVAFEDGAPSP
jgi:periplasmic protein TonB